MVHSSLLGLYSFTESPALPPAVTPVDTLLFSLKIRFFCPLYRNFSQVCGLLVTMLFWIVRGINMLLFNPNYFIYFLGFCPFPIPNTFNWLYLVYFSFFWYIYIYLVIIYASYIHIYHISTHIIYKGNIFCS